MKNCLGSHCFGALPRGTVLGSESKLLTGLMHMAKNTQGLYRDKWTLCSFVLQSRKHCMCRHMVFIWRYAKGHCLHTESGRTAPISICLYKKSY